MPKKTEAAGFAESTPPSPKPMLARSWQRLGGTVGQARAQREVVIARMARYGWAWEPPSADELKAAAAALGAHVAAVKAGAAWDEALYGPAAELEAPPHRAEGSGAATTTLTTATSTVRDPGRRGNGKVAPAAAEDGFGRLWGAWRDRTRELQARVAWAALAESGADLGAVVAAGLAMAATAEGTLAAWLVARQGEGPA